MRPQSLKNQERAKLEADIQAYLESGGQIQQPAPTPEKHPKHFYKDRQPPRPGKAQSAIE